MFKKFTESINYLFVSYFDTSLIIILELYAFETFFAPWLHSSKTTGFLSCERIIFFNFLELPPIAYPSHKLNKEKKERKKKTSSS